MATQSNNAQTNAKMASLAGKYLTYTLGHESYGVAVLKVREIVRMLNITPIPQMPDYVSGVVNLRGKVIPVIDLRIKFGLTEVKGSDQNCIVVVLAQVASGAHVLMGLVVDAVEEVANVVADEIEETPEFGTQIRTDYILGIAKIKGAVKVLLDIDKVIAGEAAELIQRVA
ncbi:MAG: chemotaxis protein CheW [Verrucomicrobiae bacterium]|nr:chemotaxis protein CheW [Verrucomicrobiae bacterium]